MQSNFFLYRTCTNLVKVEVPHYYETQILNSSIYFIDM